jgi:hypothetical protein
MKRLLFQSSIHLNLSLLLSHAIRDFWLLGVHGCCDGGEKVSSRKKYTDEAEAGRQAFIQAHQAISCHAEFVFFG